MKRKELGTQEAIDAWTQTLEHDVAELHHLDPQEGIQRVIDIEDELINIVCPPCYTTLSGCLLTILIRVASLRKIMSTYFFSYAQSTCTIFEHKRFPGLVWVQKRCAQCWWTMISSAHSNSCSTT